MSWREQLNVGELRLGRLIAQEPELQTYIADGAIENYKTFNLLDASAATADLTLTPSDRTIYEFMCVNADNSVTITLDGSWTFDGTNNIATFGIGDGMRVFADLDNLMLVLISNNGVVLSN